MTTQKSQKVFYWNCADDRNHSHKRIEWAIENGMLVCINIKISDKLISQVDIGDIILAYEPKEHKVSTKQYDGFCISCKNKKNNGKQAFTAIFKVINNPIIWQDLQTEFSSNINIISIWSNPDKIITDKDKVDYEKYSNHYYAQKHKKYIFHVKYLGYLENTISTSSKKLNNGYYYSYPVIKGFNKIYNCGCNNVLNCSNNLCIYYHLNTHKNFI